MQAEGAINLQKIEAPREKLGDPGGVDLIVFAREASDGSGNYDSSVVTVVKELREAGAAADFEHEAQARRWIGENAAETLVLDLIVGVASNAAWAALCRVLGRRKGKRVRVRWIRSRDPKSGTETQWVEAEGSGEDVAATLEGLQPDDPPQVSAGDESET